MSDTYEPIHGLLEVPAPLLRKSFYYPAELHVTRFFGGVNRGVSIQLEIENQDGCKDIQLDNKSANALLELLQDALGHVSADELVKGE